MAGKVKKKDLICDVNEPRGLLHDSRTSMRNLSLSFVIWAAGRERWICGCDAMDAVESIDEDEDDGGGSGDDDDDEGRKP